MSEWKNRLKADPLPWLLEPDEENPGVRYFALRDFFDRPEDDSELIAAQAAVMRTGPVPAILEAQHPEGYWAKPKPVYASKYRGTVHQVLLLAQLGADGQDERIRRGVEYFITHGQAKSNAFAYGGTPSTTIHCMWGNAVRALIDLGYWGDERLTRGVEALACSIIGDGYEEWYRKSGVMAPDFVCSANYGLPCAWGAVRVLWALNAVPVAERTPVVKAATKASVDFLLRYDIARADYPHQERINSSWFKFGYTFSYITDVLHNVEVLAEAGFGRDPRLAEAIELVLSKQDEQCRWKLEQNYRGKLWFEPEEKGQPSKWVTLRALRVLKTIHS
jgi:hypothetical protein